jgi:hypothetical protein
MQDAAAVAEMPAKKQPRKSTSTTASKKKATASQPMPTPTPTIEYVISEGLELTIDPLIINETNATVPAPPTIPTNTPTIITQTEECVKKRGRKPQGGKIIKKTKSTDVQEEMRPNIILHLKCFIKDLDHDILEDNCNVQPYTDDTMVANYKSIQEPEVAFTGKTIHTKIRELEQNLHTNNVNDKKACCFHCTYQFDNTPFYIPKCFMNGAYQVYGCFCMPECAAAYLFKENIDTNVKFERYYMMNHIYGKANGYTQNIKLAPSPYYFLDKFYGNLTIHEYRSLCKKEKYFFIVDKPLTRVMPELYEDNDTHIIHNKFINANNKMKAKAQSKASILNETFSGSSSH